jgi:hypothetical protein
VGPVAGPLIFSKQPAGTKHDHANTINSVSAQAEDPKQAGEAKRRTEARDAANAGPGTGIRDPGHSPQDPNPPADRAPEGPTTSYEYARGDRGAAATEHERQVRESESGPSRNDVAGRK